MNSSRIFRQNFRRIVVTAVVFIGLGFGQVDSLPVDMEMDIGRLALVQVLHRHGDRNPMTPVPFDATPENLAKEWPEGVGQLTAKGLEQTQELGDFLRTRYGGFLNDTYFSDEILVMTTPNDRAIVSALSLLRGLYPGTKPGTKNDTSSSGFNQPQIVPLRTVPQKDSQLLIMSISHIPDCPKQQVEIEKLKRESLEYQKLDRDFSNMQLEILARAGNLTDKGEGHDLLDYLYVLLAQNRSLPAWVTPRMVTNVDLHFFLNFQHLIGSPALQRLSSAFLQNVLANMEEILMDDPYSVTTVAKRASHLLQLFQEDLAHRRAEVETKNPRKVYIFSGHDFTLATLLADFGVFNNLKPPYASAVIVETYLKTQVDKSPQLFVKVLLRNSTEMAPILLEIPKCPYPCQLVDLKKIVAPIIPDDYNAECQLITLNSRSTKVMPIVHCTYMFKLTRKFL